MSNTKKGSSLLVFVVAAAAMAAVAAVSFHTGKRSGEARHYVIPGFAWSEEKWVQRSRGIRTSYNPDHDLNTDTLTLVPGDERWLDFVYWCFNNRLAEHQVEAYGGTGWQGPKGGVIFHWAPGSRWECHTLASFGFTIGHTVGEHQWMDTMFPDFFEKYGGVHGVNVKDRLAEIDSASPQPWVEFLEYCGGEESPYYRYLFHQEVAIDPVRERVCFVGGHGVGFEYSFERYYHEVREVLTDAKAVQFFQMYDRYGPGFASRGGWAKNKLAPALQGLYGLPDEARWGSRPGVAKAEKYNPFLSGPAIPDGTPERDAVKRGQEVYRKQCIMCHGSQGDGKGFLASGLEVKPRDFRAGCYRFRSTEQGQLPTFEDIERCVRLGTKNSTMPAFGQFLSDQEIRDVSRYIVTFSKRFVRAWQGDNQPTQLVISTPPADLTPLRQHGAMLYKANACHICHGEGGKGDGPSAVEQKDNWGFPIAPGDLTYRWQFKNGHTPADVYRTIFGGLDGSPMPCFAMAIPQEQDRWALVAYVLSLSPEVRPVLRLRDFPRGIARMIDKKGRVRS